MIRVHVAADGTKCEMKFAKGTNTLLWPGAKLDKFKEQLPRNKTSVFRPFKAAVLRAGVDMKLRLHDLRHIFAGLFLASGGDIKTVPSGVRRR